VTNKTDETQRVIQRAFLSAAGASIVQGTPNQIAVMVENSGATPATMQSLVEWCVRDTPLPKNFGFPHYENEQPQHYRIAPKSTTTVFTRFEDKSCPTCASDVLSHKKQLFVWGWLTCTDAFKVSHKTDYCLRYLAQGTIGNTPVNLFTPCDQGNCTDEECKEYWVRGEVIYEGCPSPGPR
jgi:hypothetical protein